MSVQSNPNAFRTLARRANSNSPGLALGKYVQIPREPALKEAVQRERPIQGR
jgi:hypothetical protein